MIRRTISYLLSTAVAAQLAALDLPVNESVHGPFPPEQPLVSADGGEPRRLTISVSVADPDDLKVKEGDRVFAGQLLADRTRDRNRLEAQAKQLDLTLQRLEHATITPPLPPQQPPAIATPTYLEETAAIDRAKADVDQVEALISAKHQELDYLGQLANLDPLVLEHETAKLADLLWLSS